MSLYIFNFKKIFLVAIISFFFVIVLFIFGSELIIRNFAIHEKNNYELVKTKLLNVKKNYAMVADSRGVTGLVKNKNFVNLSIRGINLKSIIGISEYYSYKNEIFKEIKNTFVTFSKQQQVKYKDFSQSMSNEFFENSDHLNTKGAIIFTKMLLRHCFGEPS